MASVRLVGHASVIIKVGGVSLLCDPWLAGKAFNDSWALAIPAVLPRPDLDAIDYLWISHEHPDHFHVPTLRGLPEEFKRRVPVLFHTDFTDKMPDALRKLGFGKVISLPHRRRVRLTSDVTVYCYHSGAMDSALAVIGPDAVILNNNDAELSPHDCDNVRADVGPVDVLLNQFGIAGFPGLTDYADHLSKQKKLKLERVAMQAERTDARHTIPFASFQYFCHTENKFINDYLSSPREVHDLLEARGRACIVLFPGDEWVVGRSWATENALKRYDDALGRIPDLPYDTSPVVPLDVLDAAHRKFVAQLRDRFPPLLLRSLGSIRTDVADLGRVLEFDLFHPGIRAAEGKSPDLRLSSQPLHFAFATPYGFQTLGVSGRYRLLASRRRWRNFRVLFSLSNAGLYLQPRHLLRRATLSYVWSRRRELRDQVSNRISTMFG